MLLQIEPYRQVEFTLTAFFVLVGFLAFCVGMVLLFSWMDRRRMSRLESKYPSATRKRKYPLIVDAKLDQDVVKQY
jgi:hypothetical protein